ncbi:MAG: hypothetical protein GEU91_21380 [Rhizobiales bacterium]|nr:hypothetical protein [Hyphomicrobiales bacterium]
MQSTSGLTRRHLLGGMGGMTAATVAGVDANAVEPQALGPATFLALAASDFQPAGSATYQLVSPGGVRVTAGSVAFSTGLRLPVGSRILAVWVYCNPNGNPGFVSLTRYRPLDPTFAQLAAATSTDGTVSEAVKLTLNHDVAGTWNYRITFPLSASTGRILYGARVKYRPPA